MTQVAAETPLAARTPIDVYARLSLMMFLEFFVWGAWYVTTGPFMKSAGLGKFIALAYTLCPIAAIVAPFFLGMVADRFFASERVVGVLHILGGAAMLLAPWAATQSGPLFITMLMLHALFYMPTINLTNTVAFANIKNAEKEFPLIRVFGTLGWIVAGLVISFLKFDSSAKQYTVTGIAAIVLGVYSFFLPHTPPPAKGKKATFGEIVGVGALGMLKRPSFLIFIICSFLICIPLAAYYGWAAGFVTDAGVNRVGAVMGLGQWAELFFMLAVPLCFARLGVKWMLAAGMLAWVIRYGLFAAAAPNATFPLILIGILLHGICYDFFFVTGFIYTEKKAPKEVRGQAQGFLVLMTYGLGLGIGAQLMGWVSGWLIKSTGAAALPEYQKFWLVPCLFALAVLVIFVLTFKDDSNEPVQEPRGFEVK